ncbi:hypothetical protein L3X38_010908 [Prunus dulcis]|uniref:Retrotransposon gag domain-containing protein n=1 Tax=Prunus dulcis TaxID=3755 RepID=A0AAD4WIM6_PRUDU|nr:hypothetical protein L3X38_010908 [Prunus dulcis]
MKDELTAELDTAMYTNKKSTGFEGRGGEVRYFDPYMHCSRTLELIPLDPEIEQTFHKRNKGNKKHTLVEPPSTPMAERAVGEFGPPVATPSVIRRPTIAANNFEIKPAMITMLQNSSVFCGLPNEDPNIHLAIFLEICDTSKFNGVTDDAIRLRLFPFSLKDKAKLWLLSQPQDSIPQYDKEPLYEAWERFKDLLRKCPHHELPTWIQVQTFYNGLSQTSRTLVDAAAGGALMTKTATEEFELLETMASNNYQWPSERMNLKPAGVLEVDAMALLTAQISNLTKKVDSLSVNAINTSTNFGCELCAGPHPSSECTIGNPFASAEQVNQQVNITVDLEQEALETKKEAKKFAAERGHAFSPPITTTEKSQEEENSIPIPSPQLKPYVPQIPFPQRLRKNKVDGQFAKFLEMFRKLHINIPFAEALEQMPSYAKFMKDILSKKRKFGEHEKIQLTEECSAILQRKLPPKQKDRGSFKIGK